MKFSATTMKIALFLLCLIAVQTMAEQFEEKTGEIPPIPSDPTLDPPPPSPSSNIENTMFMPENSFFDDITMLLSPEPET
ncbi:unnamed protein product [Brassica rapa]|uniref:Uncharacterized protein n=2 Tax=Brassica campestris TaxID=3711 RepID=A0A8D9D7U6_BRACM|nr:uncharacterized protein LOC111198838 [Brassica napus]CAG7868887.1 unnamed protein product [Brassica rapa]